MDALQDELGGQHGLSTARRADDQDRISVGNASREHLVQALDARRTPRVGHRIHAHLAGLGQARIDPHSGRGQLHGVQPGDAVAAPHLHDAELTNDRVATHALGEPDHAIGDGEHGRGLPVGLEDEEGGGLPAGEAQAQGLHEVMQRQRPGGAGSLHDREK